MTEGAKIVRPLPFSLPITTLEAMVAHWRKEALFPKEYDVYHVAQQFLIPVLPSSGLRVATVHDLRPLVIPEGYPFTLRRVLRRIVKHAGELEMIITDSQSTKSDLVRLADTPEEKIAVIPLGHSENFRPRQSRRNELGIGERGKLLLHVGTEDDSKNIPFLFAVLKKLTERFQDIQLLRACVGKRKKSTDYMIASMGLIGRVKYVSAFSEEEMAEIYSSADLLLEPSLYEGFGLPPLEAMASGLPVVCSDRSSLPEVVGDAGLVLPLEVNRWADEVSKLISDGGMLETYRRLGLERARKFTWSNCASQTAMIYNRINP